MMRGSNRGRGAGSVTNGTRADANTPSRGSIKEKAKVLEIVHTKPAEINSKKGTVGRAIDLKTNHFPVKKGKHFVFQQYYVAFIPDVEIPIVRKALIREHKKVLGGYLYDGVSTIYLTKSLEKDTTDFAGKLKDDSLVKITVKKTMSLITATDGRVLQLLNLILRRSMEGLKLQLVGRNLYDAGAVIKLKDLNLQLWPGYITSIRQHENGILLCCELDHKVMRIETAYDILRQCLNNSRNAKDDFMKQMIGTTVITGYNNESYRIDDVDWNSTPASTFITKNGPVSYKEYYKKRYNIEIFDVKQPLLISKPRARELRAGQSELIALIPELCNVTGLTDEMRKNYNLMNAVAVHTRLNPQDRVKRLLDFNQRLQKTAASTEVLQEYNVDLSKELIQLKGRVFPPEKIYFGNKKEAVMDQRAEWTQTFRSCKLFTNKKLTNWFVVTPTKIDGKAQVFVAKMIEAGKGMGFIMDPPVWKKIDQDRNEDYIRGLNDVINKDPKLIMIVVTNDRADRYAAIKRKLCIDSAIPSQVVKLRTIDPKNIQGLMSVATKVAVQMFTKIEGVPWMISLPLNGLMTVGFDVTHDTRDRSKSYGAFVATMDIKTSSRYFSTVESHTNGEELSNNIGISMIKALRVYKETHNTLPERILIYRDGVGDGQIKHVHEFEVLDLKRKIKAAYGEAKTPLFAFVLVSKRINTRIFTMDNMNPPVGTVVDDVITLPERYDFFLVSTGCRTGTVSPTSYNVINGCLGLQPDKFQLLTFKMCHLYYNWSGTIRVPAVVQYAHKLAFLVGQYLHQAPSNLLEKQLYFL
ncbi:unnamed protein product [Diamesa serratosioi]